MLDGASNDEAWGRQTMLATVPVGAVQEMSVLSNAFSAGVRLDRWPGAEHRHQVRHQRAARRGALPGPARAPGRPRRSRPTASARRRSATCTTPTTLERDQPGRRAGRAASGLRLDRRARSSRTGPSSSRAPTTPGRIARRSCRRRCRRSCCRPTATSAYDGQLPAEAAQRAARSQALAEPDADGAVQLRSLLRHQPERRRRRHQRAERGAPLRRAARGPRRPTTPPCSGRTSSTRRASPISTAIRSR